ncbi:MAG TPA: MaoC/PaaZ C-terminal domain-containing protein [Acidimicrobiia bacterium]|nr:MaoC/PaaZ C-terminal domain-containing protein [Acidimicrobiia bacterium]
MGGLDDLTGSSYGPFVVEVSADRVTAFAAAIGDDPHRWLRFAPPLFANAALFAAAPAFLEDPAVAELTRSLIHSEQQYTWSRPLEVGEVVAVAGTVASVRARGALNLVTFEVEVHSAAGPWLTGSSLFLMAAEAAASGADEPEPPVALRPLFAGGGTAAELPESGGSLPPYPCGASRADLVRYAAASRDWNPIHWDHDSARGAGLPGTIVHGLLMAAWMANAVCRLVPGGDPLREMRVRFRNPLRPAVAAEVTGTVVSAGGRGAEVDLILATGDERLATGRIRVTR